MRGLKSITSADNDQYRELKKLLTSHGLKKSPQYLLSGEKVLRELLSAQPDAIEFAIYPSEEMYSQWQVPGVVFPAELFSSLDVMGTGGPLMVVRKAEHEVWQESEPRGLRLFCPLGDPKNVGALLRSALAFGVECVVLLKESASPYLPEALRAAAGSHLHLSIKEGPALSELRGPFVTLEGGSKSLISEWRWPRDVNLLVGEEGLGLERASQIQRVPLSIPMDPRLDSLNASVAASLALYDYRRSHPLHGSLTTGV